MANQKFKTGDVVEIKSGGPSMTVRNYRSGIRGEETSEVVCNYYEGNDLKSVVLQEDQLNKLE